MDWIEKLFGIKPDNGDGSMELLIAIAVSILVVPSGMRWFRQRARARAQKKSR